MFFQSATLFTRINLGLAGAIGVAVATVAPVAAVHAEDGKVYPSAMCVPYAGGPALTHFDANSFNTSGRSLLTVICPGVKDEVNVTNGLNSAYLNYYKYPTGTLYATLLSTSRDYRFSAIVSRTDATTIQGYKTLTLPPLAGFAGGYYTLKVSLPLDAGILSYQFNEYQP
jgi:hypothetical protein